VTHHTTSTAAASHGTPVPRGLEVTPSSPSFGGRYGRMFRNLPSYDISDASLIALAGAMIQPVDETGLDKPLGTDDDDENTATLPDGQLRLPAGYTYFGQFVDHDITFDPVSSLSRQNDPDALTDFRTPRFDLDSVYGRGPSDQPYLYEPDGLHLTLGQPTSGTPATAGPDLLRVPSGRAITGDPRNDENLIVSQLQVAMIRFHNAIVDRVRAANPNFSAADVLKSAQQSTRWHYQWIVIHDFLPRLVGEDVVTDILAPTSYLSSPSQSTLLVKPNLRFYHWKRQPYMPLEFSVAAYRYGHSMIRPSYLINTVAVTDPPVPDVNRIPLFSQTGSAKQSLNGFRVLPSDWGVQWQFFLPGIGGQAVPNLPQPSYKLDATLSNPLGALPASTSAPEVVSAGFLPEIAQSLATRNLLRGKRLSLPSGQDVAAAMGITPLTDAQLFTGTGLSHGVLDDLAGRAPLWYYILKEAEVIGGAAQLGPVGGRIVAEVLIGLLAGDPLSFLNVSPSWHPTLPAATAGHFTLSDLINVAIPPASAPPVSPYAG
jgi:hypothetical protein